MMATIRIRLRFPHVSRGSNLLRWIGTTGEGDGTGKTSSKGKSSRQTTKYVNAKSKAMKSVLPDMRDEYLSYSPKVDKNRTLLLQGLLQSEAVELDSGFEQSGSAMKGNLSVIFRASILFTSDAFTRSWSARSAPPISVSSF